MSKDTTHNSICTQCGASDSCITPKDFNEYKSIKEKHGLTGYNQIKINYIQKVRNILDDKLKMGEDYNQLLDLYTLLVFVTQGKCTNEQVHDAWSIWQDKTEPNHKSIIPFRSLIKELQELDSKYRDAINETYHQIWCNG